MSYWLDAAGGIPPSDKIDKIDENRWETASTGSPPSDKIDKIDFIQPGGSAERSDVHLYAEALRRHGPTSYGTIGVLLGWGMTRAAEAETRLRLAGRIEYDRAGRGRLV